MSKRQNEILKYALENGYYEIPRKIHIKDIASNFNISGAAINELMRKSEKKIYDGIMAKNFSTFQ